MVLPVTVKNEEDPNGDDNRRGECDDKTLYQFYRHSKELTPQSFEVSVQISNLSEILCLLSLLSRKMKI